MSSSSLRDPPGHLAANLAPLAVAAHPTEDGSDRVNVAVLEDIQTLAQWEYWIQLSLFTADLHVLGGWTLATHAQEDAFEAKAQALQGPTVFSILDLNELETPQSLENIVAEGRIRSDWRKQVFPTGQCRPPVGFEGNPSGAFRVMICKLALGAVLSREQQRGDGTREPFETCPIPGEFTAMSQRDMDRRDAAPGGSSGTAYRVLYRVRRADQVLPSVVLEFEMKPLRIHVPQPVCELCEALPATLFCPADRAHLCDECDERVHSSTRMLARHNRVPATHVSEETRN
ncbi:b-box zinc finger domain-containing protein [Cystoisospora suis]|uniref:B-box zinc finger domain-containing protein n=1 Tax=Cystoisospora suis TaxID=483139 RepID=A0A2C6KKE1_9APIC|nr:b-box zinc finger domain-containing protein [Cystoisospora suis]